MAILDELQRMSDERFLALYEGLSQQGYGPLDGEVAKALKFRPQAIKKLPMEQRAKRARALAQRSAGLAYELLGSWLVRERKELVTGFLDATGVAHEDGMIEDVEGARPDVAKLADALDALDARFPAEDVTLYLALCVEMWPESEALRRVWSERSGAPAA
jgi:hypothetical protein